MKNPTTTLGAFLRSRRMALEITSEELGKHLSVSRQTVSDWELGKSRPVKRKHEKLCNKLKLDPAGFNKLFRGVHVEKSELLLDAIPDSSETETNDSHCWKTRKEVLDEALNLASESTVLIASSLRSKEIDGDFAKVIARNLTRNIKHFFAFPEECLFKAVVDTVSIFGNKEFSERSEDAKLRFCKLERDECLLERRDIDMAIGLMAVIFDERGKEIKKENKLRGYVYVEYYKNPNDDFAKDCLFLPIYLKTVKDLLDFVVNKTSESE